MDVTEKVIAAVPLRNLRVPLREFAVVWRAAEARCAEQAAVGVTDWYAGGVAMSCRWLAGAVVSGPRWGTELAPAPVTRSRASAYEELVEAEYLAAERLDIDPPSWVLARPGWSAGVRTTLGWVWRRACDAPFPTDVPAHLGNLTS